MADKQNITLRICGKDYALTIDSEKEEIYRIAAEMVNTQVSEYAKHSIEDYTTKDYLALAAFQFARDSIVMSQSREVGNEDVKELGKISDKISEYMNWLDQK